MSSRPRLAVPHGYIGGIRFDGRGGKMGLEAVVRQFPNGAIIIKQGDPGQSMFLIRSGKVRIFNDAEGGETTLTTLGQGDFFGEMALFDDHPRSASAEAVGDVQLAEVS